MNVVTTPSVRPTSAPPAPQSLDEAGLNAESVVQLALKTLHMVGQLTGGDLALRLGLPYNVLQPVIESIKVQRHSEIVGGGLIGGASYMHRITDAGRMRAALFLEHSQYIGVAPVPIDQYRDYMRAFERGAMNHVTRERVEQAFSHLVLSRRVLDQLGPAVNAGHSLFVYGPPGNGKTVISRAIRNLLDGDIAVPHAIEVEGSIIRFFDPVNHEAIADSGTPSLDAGDGRDARWVRCRRPLVMVGGELALSQLELTYSHTLGFYRAPLQAIANGGVLVVDDFGRQACSPRDLLNRWIVPLESRTDFLTLQSGQKVEFPFLTMIVFATNLRPSELVDEAFLRRIRYKVFAESPTVPEFKQIFESCCREQGVEYRQGIVDDLLASYYRRSNIPLRGCHPRDLLQQVASLAEYHGKRMELSAELLAAACESYFVDDRSESAAASTS